MSTIQSQSTINPNSVSQVASVGALKGPMGFIDERNAVFAERCDLCLAALNAVDDLSCAALKGAFYLLPSCAGVIGRKRANGHVIESARRSCWRRQASRWSPVPHLGWRRSSEFHSQRRRLD
ncbi:hypothetical protein [Bradyrhizobium brasilense]|uniref:hypothetical protein n=1 Tax=Bradyrhizobium brasilense TaxID=1419277 RepID=UPI003D3241D1